MIVVTGAGGFIGSALVTELNIHGFRSIICVDDFNTEKLKNLANKDYLQTLHRDKLFSFIKENENEIEFVFHLGARTDTAEFDYNLLKRLNLDYSKEIWQLCCEFQIPLIYASSAATYGLGEEGFDDNEESIPTLKPLNPYGESKQQFDEWVLQQQNSPFFWAGFKFFNVYGPNEYHKGRMASVVFHAYNQIKDTEGMKLFRSHNPQYKNGEQLRDFVYIKDVVAVLYWFMQNREHSGIYNLGSGKARTFLDLVRSVFKSLEQEEKISFIDTPEDIRDKYQYFTEAPMDKLKQAGCPVVFTALEEGVEEYVQKYLVGHRYF